MYWVFWEFWSRAAPPLSSLRPSRPSTCGRMRRFAADAPGRSFAMALLPPIFSDRRRDGTWADDRSQVGNRARQGLGPPWISAHWPLSVEDLSGDEADGRS